MKHKQTYIQSLVFIIFFVFPNGAPATFSTIKLGGQVNKTSNLVSKGGNFTLGFFNENASYLGIWYTSDIESKKVWVANPNAPITSTSGAHALSIDAGNGNLIITDDGTTLMTISDFESGLNPINVSHVTATLEDNGNFRLINEIDKRVLWQSFDHPTDVLLPGMKLGYDIKTGQKWGLTSWLSNEIPESGAFTLTWEVFDEMSHRLMIRQRGQPYWSSATVSNQVQFVFSKYGYTLTSVYSNTERYISYKKDPNFIPNDSNDSNARLPMWILTPKAEISDGVNYTVFTPKEFCNGFDLGNGCAVELSLPACRRESDHFSYRNGNFGPQTTVDIDSNSTLSISDCLVKCRNDCGCVGFNSSNGNGTGCIFWGGSISNSFFDNSNENSTWVYAISSQNPSTGKKTKFKTKLILALLGTIIPLFLLCSGLLLWLNKRKLKQKEEERQKTDEYFPECETPESFTDAHHHENNGKGNDLVTFSFASIAAATNDFSSENKLGQGGFGPVYKGRLTDGQEIAIKRLSKTSGQGLVEFKNELILIAKLQHTNLVRVLGYCIHREEKMLIYEYMSNKSLNIFLFDESRKVELDWPKRFSIIEGIAQGLLYLHKYSRMRVIHRDLKASNILLDKNMNPKISDFGMARMFKENETEAMTKRVVGTFGYMSPEYITEGTFSMKSDIFSFGVLILEIISGRKNSCFVHLDRTFNLIGYAWELWQQGKALELEDMTLRNTCVVRQFLRTVHVALLCVQDSATDRPTTSDMISMLLNDTISLPAPNKPAFFIISRDESKSTPEENKPKEHSVNNMTVTVMDGR